MKQTSHHEALLYKDLPAERVKCNLCGRRCEIPEGKVGFCRVRKNYDGRLYTLSYGEVCSLCIDPIGKKPLAHFNPGSLVLSVAAPGCNFRCRFCDNWTISQELGVRRTYISPERLVEAAVKNACQGISYTYTEPTVFFEYALDASKLADGRGIFNTFVTNGYMTPEAVRMAAPYLDAATVDFKGGGDEEFYRVYSSVPSVEPIFQSLREMAKEDIHIEVTNLVVPEIGDSLERIRELASWIRENLGGDTPLHLLRYNPNYRLTEIPSTSISTLEAAYEAAKEEGLNYVYLGNAPGHKYENTYCPNCGELLIKRFSFEISRWRITRDMRCPSCSHSVPIKGRFHPSGYSHPYSLI